MMPEHQGSEEEFPAALDRALKALVECVPSAFLRLAGVSVAAQQVHFLNAVVNIPELRADHVFRVGERGAPGTWIAHVEYQLQPDLRALRGWILKNAALNYQFEEPVLLLAVYLQRGKRASFPASHRWEGGVLTNEYRFEALRVWEHLDRIRSGDLPELAPLLVLCEDEPDEQTLVTERTLIRGAEAPPEVRRELFGVALMLGVRRFSRALLELVFREELPMIKESSIIDDWIREGEERGVLKGVAQGVAQGLEQGARAVVLRQLHKRFGELSPEAIARIEALDASQCEELAERLLDAASLQELGLA